MATDKKAIQKTAVKKDTPVVDPVIKEEKVEEVVNTEPVKVEEKSPMELEALKNGGVVDPVVDNIKEGLQSGAVVDPVVELVNTDAKEALRITEVVEKAFKGKGSFSDELEDVEGLAESLFGKSDQEIIEAVKPYFIFTDASQGEKAIRLSLSDIPPYDHNYGKYLEEENAKAKELMEAQNLNEIWRCPDSGYWFSRQDYAEEYERKNKCSLQHYKR